MDPVTLIAGPGIEPAWYRCPRCGARQKGAAAPPVGGIACAACGEGLRVTEQFAFAGLGSRTLSLVIDGSVLLAMYIIIAMPLLLLPQDAHGNATPHGQLAARLLYTVVGLGYFWFGEAMGATLGKRFTHTRIVTAPDWGSPGAWRGLARAVLAAVSLLPLGLGYWILLADPERRAFHDRVTGTRVIER